MSSMASISFKNINLKGPKKKKEKKRNKQKQIERKRKKEKIADIATNH